MANDEYFTPKWLFDKLNVMFDLDVASTYHPLVTVPSYNRFTIEDDGLTKDWHGRVWMNPPFSKVTPWIEKWLDHGNGLCLIPSLSSNGKWVNKLWDSQAVCALLPSNMRFQCPNGDIASIRWRTAVWAIGDRNISALKQSGLGNVR